VCCDLYLAKKKKKKKTKSSAAANEAKPADVNCTDVADVVDISRKYSQHTHCTAGEYLCL